MSVLYHILYQKKNINNRALNTILCKKRNIEQVDTVVDTQKLIYKWKYKQQTSTKEIHIENGFQTWKMTIYFIYQMHIKHTCALLLPD